MQSDRMTAVDALAELLGRVWAYARADMLARRRQLMESWAEYCQN